MVGKLQASVRYGKISWPGPQLQGGGGRALPQLMSYKWSCVCVYMYSLREIALNMCVKEAEVYSQWTINKFYVCLL